MLCIQTNITGQVIITINSTEYLPQYNIHENGHITINTLESTYGGVYMYFSKVNLQYNLYKCQMCLVCFCVWSISVCGIT